MKAPMLLAMLFAPALASAQYLERVAFHLTPTINSTSAGKLTSCGAQFRAVPVSFPSSTTAPFTILNGSVSVWDSGVIVLKAGAFESNLSITDFAKFKRLNYMPQWIKFDDGQAVSRAPNGAMGKSDTPGYFIMGLDVSTHGRAVVAGLLEGQKLTIAFKGTPPVDQVTYSGPMNYTAEDRQELARCITAMFKDTPTQ